MTGVVWTEAGEARLKDGGMGAAGISGGRRDLQPRSPGVRPRGHVTHSGTGHFLVSEQMGSVTSTDLTSRKCTRVSGLGWVGLGARSG